jgi:DNA-3-methyladenine glycosylase
MAAKVNIDEIGVDFFARDTLTVAADLLGVEMHYGGCAGIIVETEAYRDDPASHAVQRVGRARLMRETFGHIYIYKAYGLHLCLNFTTEKNGVGAVLIRALEPTQGLTNMRRRRSVDNVYELTNGPGKVCQALGIDAGLNGRPVGRELRLLRVCKPPLIMRRQRIGISKARDLEWRFLVAGNRFLSRPKG